jgi:uncharacterized membrane protein
MVSARVPPLDLASMKYNMLWDGVFHAFTWLLTAVGLGLLWRVVRTGDVPWSTRTFVGSLALGWGLFNVIEGLIDHQLLGVHHVHPGAGQVAWDIGFLAFGAVLCVVAFALIRQGRTDERRAAFAPG